jgi:hypothetical protein
MARRNANLSLCLKVEIKLDGIDYARNSSLLGIFSPSLEAPKKIRRFFECL